MDGRCANTTTVHVSLSPAYLQWDIGMTMLVDVLDLCALNSHAATQNIFTAVEKEAQDLELVPLYFYGVHGLLGARRAARQRRPCESQIYILFLASVPVGCGSKNVTFLGHVDQSSLHFPCHI